MNSRVESFLAGLVLAVAITGLTLAMVTVPWVTGMLVDRVDSAQLAGLTQPQARILAEEVRAYVTSSNAPALRVSAFGRPAFDASQTEHLDDVRGVMLSARSATLLTGVLVAAWFAWRASRGRWKLVSSAIRSAGVFLLGAVALVLLAGLADFDTLFTRFHGVFFEPGTWQFASDDLVIQLFPEPFWMAAAAIWAALLIGAGALLVAASWVISRRNAADDPQGRIAEGY